MNKHLLKAICIIVVSINIVPTLQGSETIGYLGNKFDSSLGMLGVEAIPAEDANEMAATALIELNKEQNCEPNDTLKSIKFMDNLQSYATLRENDSLEALAQLMERDDLPGNSAKQRLDFIFRYTQNGKKAFMTTHFRVGYNDSGFNKSFQDGHLYENPAVSNNQVGHFLTAVSMGQFSNWNPWQGLTRFASIGHETIGDHNSHAWQAIWGGSNPMDHLRLSWAIGEAKKGNVEKAKDYVGAIMNKTGMDRDHEAFTKESNYNNRRGNSHQDMLLTAYGYAFGQKVKNDEFSSRQEAADWLRENLGQ